MNSSILTRTIAGLLLLPILLVAAAVLIKGYADVGDGFSAGVIAALGVLLQYLAFGRERVERLLAIRFAPSVAFVGLALALAIAAYPLARGDALFTHVPGPGADVVKLGTLELITAVGFDLAVFMLVLGSVVGIIHMLAHPEEETQ